MTKQITVTVDKFGRTKVEAEGFTGTSCEAATQGIELALAGRPGPREHKPEYFESGSEADVNKLMF